MQHKLKTMSDNLLKDYYYADKAQQEIIQAALGLSHEECIRSSTLLVYAEKVKANTAIIESMRFDFDHVASIELTIADMYGAAPPQANRTLFGLTVTEYNSMPVRQTLKIYDCDLDLAGEAIKEMFDQFDKLRYNWQDSKTHGVTWCQVVDFLKNQNYRKVNYERSIC